MSKYPACCFWQYPENSPELPGAYAFLCPCALTQCLIYDQANIIDFGRVDQAGAGQIKMSKIHADLEQVRGRIDGQVFSLAGPALLLLVLVSFIYVNLEKDTGIPLVRDKNRKRFQPSTFFAYIFNANDVLREAYDTVWDTARNLDFYDH